MYEAKVVFFLRPADGPSPVRRDAVHAAPYLDYYFLRASIGSSISASKATPFPPSRFWAIGEAFNTVLAFRDPLQPIVYENYITVRALLGFLKTWIDERLDDVANRRVADPEKTMAWYWLKNAGDGAHFSKKDVVFECFHNFVALSQWGNTIFGIMSRLSQDGGDPDVRASFEKIMSSDYDNAKDNPYTPLGEQALRDGTVPRHLAQWRQHLGDQGRQDLGLWRARRLRASACPSSATASISTPHTSTSLGTPKHWTDPLKFDPERYLGVPTSAAQVDEAKARQIGFARCPFDPASFVVSDGRKAALTNSAFGTVFGVVDGKPLPVCDYAGFAPFGFGYRRCPGEQLTIQVFEDFLRKVWREKITFRKLLNRPSGAEFRSGRTP